ncbi:MAG: sulfatase [Bacteroidia bacterium]
MNKWFFLLLMVFVACKPSQQKSAQTAIDSRPNIIVIVADDHGKDAIGIYGNSVIKTPGIDRLGHTGTRFTRAFCTTASCSASRSVILSGMQNHANGQYGHSHDFHHFSSFENIRSLPVRLEEAGYRTGQIGKYHVSPESVYHFQERFEADSRSPVVMANTVEDFIKADEQQPFFLYFCFSDPHRGGGFAEELPYQPDRFGNRPGSYPGVTEVTYSPDEVIVPPFLPNTPETRAEIAQYYQSVSRLDQGVSRLLDILQESGKFDNTLVMYISDNGMAFPGAKTTLYEAGMQLPCIIKMPGQTAESVSDAMISWTDITPTLVDIAKAPLDSAIQGISLVDHLTNGTPLERTAVYASHTFHEITMYYPMRVVRGERYKLIMNLASGLEYPFSTDLYESKTWQSIKSRNLSKIGGKDISSFLHRPEFELYDIQTDPWETTNLADNLQYSELLSSMKVSLKQFQENTGDPWIYKWTYE